MKHSHKGNDTTSTRYNYHKPRKALGQAKAASFTEAHQTTRHAKKKKNLLTFPLFSSKCFNRSMAASLSSMAAFLNLGFGAAFLASCAKRSNVE